MRIHTRVAMKRPTCDMVASVPTPCKRAYPRTAETVRLNVGGCHYDTTASTLRLEYFEPILTGRIGFALDEEGRLFIDRCGLLFGHILQFLRTLQRPSQRVLDEHAAALLAECEFYGEANLPQIIRGELAPDCYLRASDRTLIQQEQEVLSCDVGEKSSMLIDVHGTDVAPRDRAQLGQPLLLDKTPRAACSGDFGAFYKRLNEFSGGLVEELKGVPGLVFAGGSVIAALVGGAAGDLDIFLTCAPEDGESRLREVYAAVQRLHKGVKPPKKRFLATRSSRAVTFYVCCATSVVAPPMQVITCTYQSTLDVLLRFDIDAACVAYSPTSEGEKVVCTPRGLRALRYATNISHGAYAGANYFRRLETYSQRGFAVALPSYDPAKVSPDFLSGTYARFRNGDSLFRLGPKQHRVEPVQVAYAKHSLRASSVATKRVRVGATQSARRVDDVQRLLVLDRITPNMLDHPEVQFCGKHDRYYVEEARVDATCTPLATGLPREYVLVWGATHLEEGSKHDDGGEGESDDEDATDFDTGDGMYEVTPLAAINLLLKRHTSRLLDADDEVSSGGALRRTLARHVSIGATRTAFESLTQQLADSLGARTKLRLVFDFVPFGAPFDAGLSWVRNARRAPLRCDWSDKMFEDTYGLIPELSFKRSAPREPIVKDFWTGVY